MKINISLRIGLYVGGVLLLCLSILTYLNYFHHSTLLREMGLSEARRLSNAVFNELYTTMMLGGGRVQGRAIIKRYEGIEGVNEIRVIHGDVVNRDFGTEADEAAVDSLDLRALKGESVERLEDSGTGVMLARYVLPIDIKDGCTSCHEAPVGTISGAVSVSLSLEKYQKIIGSHRKKEFLWIAFMLGLVSLTGFMAVKRRLIVPLNRLEKAFGALSGGELTHRVDLKTGDELEEVGTAFNNMAGSLHSANSTLSDMNKKYSMLVESAADAIVVIDVLTMGFTEANKAASVLTGYSKDELLAMRSSDLYPEDTRPEYTSRFKRWVFDGKGYSNDSAFIRKDGAVVPIDISASLLEIDGKRFIQEIWRDISERKGFEDKLRKQIEELEDRVRERTAELNNSLNELDGAYKQLKDSQKQIISSAKLVSLGEMGAGIAHELNSPLAGILSIVEVLMGRLARDDRNYFLLEKIKDAAVRSKYIILDMLTYSRPFKDDVSPIFMNSVIRSTLSLFVSEIKSTSLEVTLDLDPNIPPVPGVKGQLMEVMLNIIKNARDVLSGSGTISISSRSVEEEGKTWVVVEVRDTGPGIPEEIKDRIFDPFFSTKSKGGGKNVGLGLSISQSIIEEHGGRIEAENPEGRGALFRIVLPAAPDRAKKAGNKR
ncbi:MAG: ATP-binding protein [Thermodesulfobacteriota bacterium]